MIIIILIIFQTPSPERHTRPFGTFSTRYDALLSGNKPSTWENTLIPRPKHQSELERYRSPKPSEILAVIFKPRPGPTIETGSISAPVISFTTSDRSESNASTSVVRAACVSIIMDGTNRRNARMREADARAGEREERARIEAESQAEVMEEWNHYLRGNNQRSDVLHSEVLDDTTTAVSINADWISVANPYDTPEAHRTNLVIRTCFRLTPTTLRAPVHIAPNTQNRSMLAVPNSEAVNIARAQLALEVTRRVLGVSPLNLLSFLAINVPAIDANPAVATSMFGGTLSGRHRRVPVSRPDDGTWNSENWSGYRIVPAVLSLIYTNHDLDTLRSEARIPRRIVRSVYPAPHNSTGPTAPAFPAASAQSQYQYQRQYQLRNSPAQEAAFQDQFDKLAHIQQAHLRSQVYDAPVLSQYVYGQGSTNAGHGREQHGE